MTPPPDRPHEHTPGPPTGPGPDPGPAVPAKRVRVRVTGRVQGVWFRDSTRHEALRLGVRGWVRNTPDGAVEAAYEGEAAAVDALLEWTRHGPEHAVVAALEVREEAPREERGFRIVP